MRESLTSAMIDFVPLHYIWKSLSSKHVSNYKEHLMKDIPFVAGTHIKQLHITKNMQDTLKTNIVST